MIATLVNALLVFLGASFGMGLHGKIQEQYKNVVFTAIGCITLLLGMSMALEGEQILPIVISLVAGGLTGTFLKLEDRILALGKLAGGSDGFARGFLDSSVLFCVGAMTIIGAFEAGTRQNYEILFTKSIMDGFMAIIFTSVMGAGVFLSAVTILLYQGGLTLLAVQLSPFVSDLMLKQIAGCGGILILMIGINLLGLKERNIKTADFLPALLFTAAAVLLPL